MIPYAARSMKRRTRGAIGMRWRIASPEIGFVLRGSAAGSRVKCEVPEAPPIGFGHLKLDTSNWKLPPKLALFLRARFEQDRS